MKWIRLTSAVLVACVAVVLIWQRLMEREKTPVGDDAETSEQIPAIEGAKDKTADIPTRQPTRAVREVPMPTEWQRPSRPPQPERHESIIEMRAAAKEFDKEFAQRMARGDVAGAAGLLFFFANDRFEKDRHFVDPFMERYPELIDDWPLAMWWLSVAPNHAEAERRLARLRQAHPEAVEAEVACYDFYVAKTKPRKNLEDLANLVNRCLDESGAQSEISEDIARDFYGELAAVRGRKAAEAVYENLRSLYPWLRPLWPAIGQ